MVTEYTERFYIPLAKRLAKLRAGRGEKLTARQVGQRFPPFEANNIVTAWLQHKTQRVHPPGRAI
jgi:hypothetical protein